MAAQSKVVELIQSRIRHGDYHLNDIPGERSLAEEAGVSHMTARKAVQSLVEEGVLERAATGRLQIATAEASEHKGKLLAFLAPNYPSTLFEIMFREIKHVAQAYGLGVRYVNYAHWDDPILLNALKSFDGIILVPDTNEMPSRVREHLAKYEKPLLSLTLDLCDIGIPSLIRTPPDWMGQLLDHLHALGNPRIDCLNTQPVDDMIRQRMDQWMKWRRLNDVSGLAYNDPVSPSGLAAGRAFEVIDELLRSGEPVMKALVCTTLMAAIGAIRAFEDHGVRVGHDVVVAAVTDEGLAHWTIPRITSINLPNTKPLITECMDWFAQGGAWTGPLRLLPKEPSLFIGESTVPTTSLLDSGVKNKKG